MQINQGVLCPWGAPPSSPAVFEREGLPEQPQRQLSPASGCRPLSLIRRPEGALCSPGSRPAEQAGRPQGASICHSAPGCGLRTRLEWAASILGKCLKLRCFDLCLAAALAASSSSAVSPLSAVLHTRSRGSHTPGACLEPYFPV